MRRASSSATSRRAPPNDSSTAGVPRLRAINSRHASVISVSASYPRHDAEPSDAREHDTHGSANCPEGACHMRELPELPYGSRIDDPGGRRWPSLPYLTSVAVASAPTHEQDEGSAKNVSLTSLPSPPHTQYRTPGAQSSAFHPGCSAAGPFHSATLVLMLPIPRISPPAFHEVIPPCVYSLPLRGSFILSPCAPAHEGCCLFGS